MDEQQAPAPQEDNVKNFLRPTNIWRLIGVLMILGSHFLKTPTLKTDWFEISSLAGVGIVLVLSPFFQEVLDRWKK